MASVPSYKPKLRESAIERELVDRVGHAGGRAEKVTVIGRRGFFDRLVLLPGGRVVFVECKRPRGGIVALHQREYAERYRALGVAVALIKNSADIDRLLAGSAPTENTT
jgi:hypothetical protein